MRSSLSTKTEEGAEFLEAQEFGAALLSRKDCFSQELFAAALQKGFDRDVVDALVVKFLDLGFLNDERLAVAIAEREIGEKRRGPERVRQKLELRGVSESTIQAALSRVQVSEAELIQESLRKAKLEDASAAKIGRFLAARGFTEEAVESFLLEHFTG